MAAMLARRASSAVTGNQSMLELDQTLRRGRRGDSVKLVQEWLCLHHHDVMTDGIYGWATEQAVSDFQGATGVLPVTGEVDPQTFAMLIRPIGEALRHIEPPTGATFGQMVAAYGLQHLRQGARAVGGPNRGPWVRLYTNGDQRPRDAKHPLPEQWGAGFVSTLIAQAASSLETEPPLDFQTSATRLAADAKQRKRFISGDRAARDFSRIPTGSILLLRRRDRSDEWHHAGVVTQALSKFVRTIEGNSAYSVEENPSGLEVSRQMRSYGSLDFIVLDKM
jgi:peptidoglycan hydrolase-like protein with peptidoglycan-binding domain